MKRTAGLLIATGLLLTASYSFGKPPSKIPPPVSKTGRSNSKSTGAPVEKELEAVDSTAAANSVWAAADRDRDGNVSFGEFATVVKDSIARRVQKRFNQLDRNHDGRCTRAEVNMMPVERFVRFDLDHDGSFTAHELATVMQSELAGRLKELYVRLDLDKNGTFSVAELTPAPQPEPKAPSKKLVATRGPSPVQ